MQAKSARNKTPFTPDEISYMQGQRLGRIATLGPNGQPHVVPVSFRYNPDTGTIDVSGHGGFARRKNGAMCSTIPKSPSSSTISLLTSLGKYAVSKSAAKPRSCSPAGARSAPASMRRCSH